MKKSPAKPKKLRPLWKCPKCGHEFVTRNLWHSCSNYTLDHHFQGKATIVRKTFDKWLATVRKCGPVTVISQKTRVAFMVRVRFSGAIIRKDWVEAAMWLKRKARHPRLIKIAEFPRNDFVHYFRFERPADIDRSLRPLLREAYAIGCQRHLSKNRALRGSSQPD